MHYTSPDVYAFISKQTNDPIVERKVCEISWTKFPIYQSDINFYKKISPTFAWETFAIPAPTLCPEERKRRRLAFRNERSLYKRKCDATNRDIISMYKPDDEVTVYDNDIRRSDSRDPMDYGITLDQTSDFFQQFKNLLMKVPKMARVQQWDNENAIYTNTASYNKDCYLIFNASNNEHCLYSSVVDYSHRCLDSYTIVKSQNVYESLYCGNSSKVFWSQIVDDSHQVYHSYDIKNCSHVFACVWLSNKKYHILNQEVSKGEFEYILSDKESRLEILEKFKKLRQGTPVEYADVVRSEQIYWNNVADSKRCIFGDIVIDSEDCKYCDVIRNFKTSHDISYYGVNDTNELCYECEWIWHWVYNCLFSKLCRGNSSRVLYCYECYHCQDCFGCVWLRDKQYCIFNTQYEDKQSYEKEVSRIITSMIETWERWEFFDPQISLFGYNETIVSEYYPLWVEDVKSLGYNRSAYEYNINIPEQAPIVDPSKMDEDRRESLRDDDDLTSKIVVCIQTKKPFRIVQDELDFYRKYDISLPKLHPDVRHLSRLYKMPWRALYLRTCDKTWEDIVSVYLQDVWFPVYSEQAYQQELFS